MFKKSLPVSLIITLALIVTIAIAGSPPIGGSTAVIKKHANSHREGGDDQVFPNHSTLLKFGAGPTYNGQAIGGGGVTVHGNLTGRDSADQHPRSAITGLDAVLDNLSSAIAGGGFSGDATSYKGNATPTATEFSYIAGLTSAAQTQINTKLATATAASTYKTIAGFNEYTSAGGGRATADEVATKADRNRLNYLHRGTAAGNYVRPTKAFAAVKFLNFSTTTTYPTDGRVVFGLGDTSLATYGRAIAYDTDFGFQWANSLSRIDYTFETAAGLGCKVIKGPAHFTSHDPISISNGGTSPLALDADSGWEAIDRAVYLARKYGMKLTLYPAAPLSSTLASWGLGGSYDYTKMMNYWFIPYVTYLAQRYANDYDVVQIQPINEMGTLFPTGDWVNFQATLYDAVKAEAPNMPVILAGVYHLEAVTYDYTVMGFLDRLSAAGKLNKFDSVVDVHLYPDQDLVVQYGRANIDSYVDTGEGGPEDITAIIAKLDALSLSSIKVRIGEFGLFTIDGWYGTATTEEIAAQDLTDTFESYEDNSRIDSVMWWVTWGLENDAPAQLISGIGGLVGQPGMGIMVDNSDQAPKQLSLPSAFTLGVFDDVGNVVAANKTWSSVSGLNISGAIRSYGDQARLILLSANGTEEAPTAKDSGDSLGSIGFRGYDGSGAFSTGSPVALTAAATENFTGTGNHGARLNISVAKNGQSNGRNVFTIDNDATVYLYGGDTAPTTIPTNTYSARLLVDGKIESRSGGFVLPDGTLIDAAADLGGAGAMQYSAIASYGDGQNPSVDDFGKVVIFTAGTAHTVPQLIGTGSTYTATPKRTLLVNDTDSSMTIDSASAGDYFNIDGTRSNSAWTLGARKSAVLVPMDSATGSYQIENIIATAGQWTTTGSDIYFAEKVKIGDTTTPAHKLDVIETAASPAARIVRTSTDTASPPTSVLIVGNNDTTNGNAAAISIRSKDTGGSERQGALFGAYFTTHNATSIVADAVIFTANAGAPTEKVRITAAGAVTIQNGGSANKAVCWKSDGKTLGYCSVVVAADGTCGTCN